MDRDPQKRPEGTFHGLVLRFWRSADKSAAELPEADDAAMLGLQSFSSTITTAGGFTGSFSSDDARSDSQNSSRNADAASCIRSKESKPTTVSLPPREISIDLRVLG